MKSSGTKTVNIPAGRSPAFEVALKSLDDLRDSGLAVVPVQPTARMVAAATQMTGLTSDAVKLAYKVMLMAGGQED